MKLNKLIMMMFIAFSITLTGCQSNEDEQHYDNKLFLSTTAFTQEILFKAGDTNIVKGLSVEIAKPEAHDIKVTMTPAPELLDTYRSASVSYTHLDVYKRQAYNCGFCSSNVG